MLPTYLVMSSLSPARIDLGDQSGPCQCGAVAVLTEAAAVIVAGGIEPDPDLVAKAKDNAVNLLRTDLPCFEVVGRLYQLGIQGVVKE